MNKKIYIAGPVTKIIANDQSMISTVTKRFQKLEHQLTDQGHRVLNPVSLVNNHQLTDKSWEDIMSFLIPFLVSCDELHIMSGWEDSKGVQLERTIMSQLKKKIVYLP